VQPRPLTSGRTHLCPAFRERQNDVSELSWTTFCLTSTWEHKLVLDHSIFCKSGYGAIQLIKSQFVSLVFARYLSPCFESELFRSLAAVGSDNDVQHGCRESSYRGIWARGGSGFLFDGTERARVHLCAIGPPIVSAVGEEIAFATS